MEVVVLTQGGGDDQVGCGGVKKNAADEPNL